MAIRRPEIEGGYGGAGAITIIGGGVITGDPTFSFTPSEGTAQVGRCSFSNNRAGSGGATNVSSTSAASGGSGGAIYVETKAMLELCTMSGNSAGGMRSSSSAEYASAGSGGALAAGSGVIVRSCTITQNSTGHREGPKGGFGRGGGIVGSPSLHNTIVAKNLNPGAPENHPDVSGSFVSNGHNFIGISNGNWGFQSGTKGDLVGTPLEPIDPKLAALTIYGGSTKTHALLPESPARNAGDQTLTGTDQRGSSRPSGAGVDIGAFEAEEAPAQFLTFGTSIVVVARSANEVTLTLTRSGETSGSALARFETEPGTALPETHYISTSGTVSFAPGATAATITVPVVPEVAAGRTFTVRITEVPSSAFLHPIGAQDVMMDGGGPGTLEFAEPYSAHSENGGPALIKVVRKNGVSGTVSVSYWTSSSTAWYGDFQSTSGTLTFGPGESEQSITVPLLDDSQLEDGETFQIYLGNPGGTAVLGAQRLHTVIIASDEAPPGLGFVFGDSIVQENGGSAVIQVNRSGDLTSEVSVDYAVFGGTATASDDFTPSSGTLVFPPGQAQQLIFVPIVEDGWVEPIETIVLNLSNPSNGTSFGPHTSHTCRVVSTDGPTTFSFVQSSTTIAEPAGNQTLSVPVTIVRSGYPYGDHSVRLVGRNGTAIAGRDFQRIDQIVHFETNVPTSVTQIEIHGDFAFEPEEKFSLLLIQEPTENGEIVQQTISIVDTTSSVAFAQASTRVDEDSGTASVEIVRAGNLDSTFTVKVTSSDGIAIGGQDYSPVSQTLTFSPGVQSILVPVVIPNDSAFEPDKGFTLSLSEVGAGAFLGPQATHAVTILDTDPRASEVIQNSGAFGGLGQDPETLEYAGIQVAMTVKGKGTVQLRVRGKTVRSIGVFDSRRVFSQTLRDNAGFPGGSIALALTDSEDALEGSLYLNDGTCFAIRALRHRTGSRHQPVPEMHAYTAVLEHDGGAGFMRTTVNHSGDVKFTGVMRDGSRFAGSSHLGMNGVLPLYIPCFTKKAGYLAGFTRIDSESSFVWRGNLRERDSVFNEIEIPIEIIGAPYTPPKKERILDDFGQAQLLAKSFTVPVVSPISFTWRTDNTVWISNPAERTTTRIHFAPNTGLFSGHFEDSEYRMKYYGICVQHPESGEDIAAGFWIIPGDGSHGRVEIVAD